MDTEITDPEKTNSETVAPPTERPTAQPDDTAQEPETGSQDEEPGRLKRLWDEWKAITLDRRIELFVAFAILVAAIVSALVAARQWSAMTESNQINRDAFTSVQRAFVTVSSFETPIRMTDPPGGGEQIKTWWFQM